MVKSGQSNRSNGLRRLILSDEVESPQTFALGLEPERRNPSRSDGITKLFMGSNVIRIGAFKPTHLLRAGDRGHPRCPSGQTMIAPKNECILWVVQIDPSATKQRQTCREQPFAASDG